MKKTVIFLSVFLIVCLIILTMNYPLTKNEVVGRYVNMNYNQPICCIEAPHKPDTLILFKDGTFQSAFYRKGTYEIGSGFETELVLRYTDFGKGAIFCTYFENKLFDKTKIVLNADTNHFYQKID